MVTSNLNCSNSPATRLNRRNSKFSKNRSKSADSSIPDNSRNNQASAEESSSTWSKCLYISQPYPDNHVDCTFLHSMQRNLHVRFYTFRKMSYESGVIIQQISIILAFVFMFMWTWEGWLGVSELILVANFSSLLAYFGWVVFVRRHVSFYQDFMEEADDEYLQGGDKMTARQRQKLVRREFLRRRGRETIKNAMIFILILMGISPILKTLTEDFSNDTIWAVSLLCFAMCFITHKYDSLNRDHFVSSKRSRRKSLETCTTSRSMSTLVGPEKESLDLLQYSSISLNFAMMASVLLASRLPTNGHVFGLIFLAVNLFAFFPVLLRAIKTYYPAYVDLTLTFTIIILTSFMIVYTYSPLLPLYLSLVFFIMAVCPFWLVRMQKFKNKIHGPWDEAVVVLSRSPKSLAP